MHHLKWLVQIISQRTMINNTQKQDKTYPPVKIRIHVYPWWDVCLSGYGGDWKRIKIKMDNIPTPWLEYYLDHLVLSTSSSVMEWVIEFHAKMSTEYKTIKIPRLPASASPYDKGTTKDRPKSPRKEGTNSAKNVNCNNNQSQKHPPERLDTANRRITKCQEEKPRKLIGWEYPKVLQTERPKTSKRKPKEQKEVKHKRSEVEEVNKLVNKKMWVYFILFIYWKWWNSYPHTNQDWSCFSSRSRTSLVCHTYAWPSYSSIPNSAPGCLFFCTYFLFFREYYFNNGKKEVFFDTGGKFRTNARLVSNAINIRIHCKFSAL